MRRLGVESTVGDLRRDVVPRHVGPARPDVLEALSKPLPDDPKQFEELWEKLTPEETDSLYQRDHSIGNRDGMPTVDRDYYNRQTLGDELTRAQAAQAQADALKNQDPDWARVSDEQVRSDYVTALRSV